MSESAEAFLWAVKNGDIDAVKQICDKVSYFQSCKIIHNLIMVKAKHHVNLG